MAEQSIIQPKRGKELRAVNPQVTVVYRFIGKLLYIQTNSPQAGAEAIAKLRAGGAEVLIGKEWIQIDLFNGRTFIKLGAVTIDLEETEPNEVADILCEFYRGIFQASGMEVFVSDL